MEKKYWSTMEELTDNGEFEKATNLEFQERIPTEDFLSDDKLQESNTGRRDFLKFMGFSVAAASLAACETPVIKSIPYVTKPEQITPGVALYYASTYYDGNDYASILVKTREGRPIFIKGNSEDGIQNGAVNARIVSSVLNLYDSTRLVGPVSDNNYTSWSHLDNAVKKGFGNGETVVLSNTIASPSTQRAIDKFVSAHGGKHVTYDAVSYNGIRKAHDGTHGKSVIPAYDFSKAKTIVGIACDFLGTWMLDNIQSAQYAEARKPGGDWMNKHYHFESNMSTTGSNSDYRARIKPSQEGLVAVGILNALKGSAPGVELSEEALSAITMAAKDLKASKGASLVVSGSNDVNIQMVVNQINSELGNYGKTLNIDTPCNLYNGDDAAMTNLVADMNAGKVGSLVVYGCNPVYDWYDGDGVVAGLEKVANTVSLNLYRDETAALCSHMAPDHHFLEAWNDLSVMKGRVDLVQPTITPLHNTRPAQESLLTWAGDNSDYYSFMRGVHNTAYDEDMKLTDQSWNSSLAKGYMNSSISVNAAAAPVEEVDVAVVEDTEEEVVVTLTKASADIPAAISAIKSSATKGGEYEVKFYQKVGIGTGHHTANPLMQELPDPITKVTWDNYVTMSPVDMDKFGFEKEIAIKTKSSVAKVEVNGKEVLLPVYAAAGQAEGTIGIAVGYGRGKGINTIGRAAYQTAEMGEHLIDDNGDLMPIGANVYPLMANANGSPQYNANATITDSGEEYFLASTQMQSTVMGRTSIVKETNWTEFKKYEDAKRGDAPYNEIPSLVVHEDVNNDGDMNALDKKPVGDFDLWKEHPVNNVGHRWGMSVDLNSCTGCSACVVACHLENNVPVVGKDEVRRHRDMHWMRIDRFFSSDYATVEETKEAKDLGSRSAYMDMEHPSNNPETVHMPMMCQHCNHAPCETVCPVAATTHSNDGLNMMAYNRCIGTRYCGNNCPYKVRRFNWFNYPAYKKFQNVNPAQDALTRMVLNPDVVVRTRGVMEKCSMCVQRIQKGRLDAKVESRSVADGDIVTACAEACPTNAITFGDINDKKSVVRTNAEDVRAYRALEEIGTKSNIYYLTKVRNKG